MLLKRKAALCILTFVSLIIYSTWKHCTTITSTKDEFKIPNTVHYVLYNQTKLDFITYLSILSVLKVQKPETIQIYIDKKWVNGYYWELISNIETNTTINLNYIDRPSHVYGQRLSSVYHASDVTRIYVLKVFGGIYLDKDVLVLKSLNLFRKNYDMVVGCPDGESIGTQVEHYLL